MWSQGGEVAGNSKILAMDFLSAHTISSSGMKPGNETPPHSVGPYFKAQENSDADPFRAEPQQQTHGGNPGFPGIFGGLA